MVDINSAACSIFGVAGTRKLTIPRWDLRFCLWWLMKARKKEIGSISYTSKCNSVHTTRTELLHVPGNWMRAALSSSLRQPHFLVELRRTPTNRKRTSCRAFSLASADPDTQTFLPLKNSWAPVRVLISPKFCLFFPITNPLNSSGISSTSGGSRRSFAEEFLSSCTQEMALHHYYPVCSTKVCE